MRWWNSFIVVLLLVALSFSGIFIFYKRSSDGIRDFVFEKDFEKIDKLFHKGQNWYWLISDYSSKTYSIDFMLRYRSSSQYEKRYDLVLKVLEIDGDVAGFLAYYPKSLYTWQLLFLVVDQDYRKKGIAKKLLKYAVADMVNRGAIKIDLVTRPVNVKAKALYSQFGFKQIDEDNDFASFTLHKSWQ